jgi:hypothetical protein
MRNFPKALLVAVLLLAQSMASATFTRDHGPGTFFLSQYGAVGKATDDCPNIQRAFNDAAAYGVAHGGGQVWADGVTYSCATTLNYDPSVVSVHWNGAYVNCTMTSGYCVNVAQTNLPSNTANNTCYRQAYRNVFEDVYFEGPGRTSSTKLFNFASVETTPNTCFNSRSVFRNVAASFFQTGITINSNAYLIMWYGIEFHQMTYGIQAVAGSTNSGENISFFGGSIGECNVAVDNEQGMYLNFNMVSFDFDIVNFYTQYGPITCVQCHFEALYSSITVSPIPYAGTLWFSTSNVAGSLIHLIGGDMNMDGAGPVTGASCYFLSSAPDGKIIMDGVQFYNMSIGSNYAACGSGLVKFTNSITPQYSIGWSGVHDPADDLPRDNLIADGGFENSTITDTVWISNDTTMPVTNRTTGTNLSMAVSTDTAFAGSQSLKITKTGASGTAATVSIAAPFPHAQIPLSTVQYAVTGTQTGSITFTALWAEITGFATGGVPIIGKTAPIGTGYTFTKTLTGSAVAWTGTGTTIDGDGTSRPPAWANYLLFQADLTNMNAGSVYIDNAVFNSM